jgi:branched-chain amino acid aminotransferase
VRKGIVSNTKFELDPAAGSLHYADALIGGMRTYRVSPQGPIAIFGAADHAARMARDASYYGIPFTAEDFLDPLPKLIRAIENYIPPYDETGNRYLYIRPIIFASGKNFKIGIAPEYTFAIIATPSEGFIPHPFKVIAVPMPARADAMHKTVGNYTPFNPRCRMARAQGFNQILHLDQSGTYADEVGPSNVFFVMKNGTIYTPNFDRESLLPGITRHYIIMLAKQLNMHVHEANIPFAQFAPDIAEAFACGTAFGVAPIDSIFYPSSGWNLKDSTLTARPHPHFDQTLELEDVTDMA